MWKSDFKHETANKVLEMNENKKLCRKTSQHKSQAGLETATGTEQGCRQASHLQPHPEAMRCPAVPQNTYCHPLPRPAGPTAQPHAHQTPSALN